MSIGLAFWILMVIWIVFGIIWRGDILGNAPGARLAVAGGGLAFVLFFLLGWKVFGFILHG